MQIELTASMMCAYYGNLEKEVKELDKGGIDSFHIDIMDGRYVPNYAMSLNDMCCKETSSLSNVGRSDKSKGGKVLSSPPNPKSSCRSVR